MLVVIHLLGAWHEWTIGLSGFWDGVIFERDVRFRVSVGGQHADLVSAGDVWRLWTSILLHNDILHLFLNSLALLSLGRIIEGWVGSVRWMSWFILGGLSGSLTSYFVGVVQSDGASGGAFALLGAAAVIGLRVRKRLDPREALLMGPVLWGFVVFNLLLPIVLPFIDSAGHIGGLVMGMGLGAVVGMGEARALWYCDALWVCAFVIACGFGWSMA